MHIGSKVQVHKRYILKIAEKDLDTAKFLVNKTGVIVGFDEITWYFNVKFEDREYSFRRFQLVEISEE